MLELEYKSKNSIYAGDQSTKDILQRGFFGSSSRNRLRLSIIEALYLIDVRNARCTRNGAETSFSELAAMFSKHKRFMARYLTYKDWRDRGLVIRDMGHKHSATNKNPIKLYPSGKFSLAHYSLHGAFFWSDMTTIISEKEKGRELYDKYWFGQYGSYKAADRGQLSKLDIYETIFLMEKGVLAEKNATKPEIIRAATARRRDFPRLYEVYRDWREKGYVIKTGFKFGTHFRVYFPGARPSTANGAGWTHSRHVIHVFPKDSRLLISEWARAIRVAHSVGKTFILAVPGSAREKKMSQDFILYHRKGGEAESPGTSSPRYVMLSLGEEEYIGGREFAGAIAEAKRMKLEPILAIADRETAVTYYKVRQIRLPGSDSDYYEIDWMQP
jgi:tRNA-intron endonuclease